MTDESTNIVTSSPGTPRGLITWICSTVSLNLVRSVEGLPSRE